MTSFGLICFRDESLRGFAHGRSSLRRGKVIKLLKRTRMSQHAERGAAISRIALGLVLLVAATLVGARPGFAQTSTLGGSVRDAQGGALVGATVTVESEAGSVSRITATDETGGFRLDPLPPGVYRVSIALPGFEPFEGTVTLEAGASRVLDVRLTLSPLAQRVDVIAVAPGHSGEVSRGRIPASVSRMDEAELSDRRGVSPADALHERLGAVTLEEATTNPFQPNLRFRGFTASPLLGLPQGVAVYQNGVRINEPFGDTVQFDLIPQFALESLQLSAGAEPVFGLNALGGALSLRLKNGFEAPGLGGELFGGSFERVIGTAEVGVSRGSWAFYTGATRFSEAGWRQESDSDVTQAVADVSYRRDRVDFGVSFTYADTKLNGNGAAPVELLDVDRTAVFTYPDTTENRLAFVEGRFQAGLSPSWSLRVSGFYRDLDQRTLNGDEAEFGVCEEDVLPPGAPRKTLCAGANGEEGEGEEEEEEGESGADVLVDATTGRFITGDDAEGNGAFNRTRTRTDGYGSSIEAVASKPFSGRDNVLVIGASVDLAAVAFGSSSEVGTLTGDRTVSGSGLYAGILGEAPDDRFNTSLETENRAFGFYVTDTLSLTENLHVTLSGRYNDVRLDIRDQLGTSLDGDHRFTRVNPAAGVVYAVSPAWSIFGRYSESSRAPTAAELSCADPDEPCRVPNAFVSDPPLEQAVARSVEGGFRGSLSTSGELEWSVTAYRTDIRDDILFVASPELIGTGYFQNAGDTRRAGVDVDLSGGRKRFQWYASYGLVEATFQSRLVLPGDEEVNDAAEDGSLPVEPGDRLPGIPVHSLKAGLRYALTGRWDVALESIVASSRFFHGDEGNDQDPLEGYGIVILRTSYAFSDRFEIFARVGNLFDAEYATFGALAEVEIDLEEAPEAHDPRFVSPGAPRSVFGGMRVRF
jgi:outer membrane receptor protein involved in Fe transport